MTTTNDIHLFIHCNECLEIRPEGYSPKEWARLSVGVTSDGLIQVWCVRHNMNIIKMSPEKLASLAHAGCDTCESGHDHGH